MEGKIRKKLIGAGNYPFAHQIDPLIATCQSRTKLPLLAAQLCPLRASDDLIASKPVDSKPATDQSQCPSNFVPFNSSVLLQQQGSARGLFRSDCHRYHAGVLKSALGGNREYFHSQTLGDSDRLKAGETGDFIQHRGIDRNESETLDS
jgi:hypothetical protein